MSDLHFIYENDKVYAIREGKVVASAENLATLETKLAWDGADTGYSGGFGEHEDPNNYHDGPCAGCGTPLAPGDQKCEYCGHPAGGQQFPEFDPDGNAAPYGDPGDDYPDMGGNSPWDTTASTRATHIVTPGGLKGKILSRVNDVWGEEVAVRLENGRIAHLRVTEDTRFSTEKTASTRSAAVELTSRLEAPFGSDRASITARLKALEGMRSDAIAAQRTASHEDAQTLDGIVVAADAERGTLRQALDAIEAQEAQAYAYKPLEYTAGPVGESLGGGEASWLDNTVNEMIAEAEGTDFDKVLTEEPHTLVASLSDGTVADMGSTRAVALAHIRSKVAGIAPERAQEITQRFLTSVEETRRSELANRKQTTHKEASAKEDRYAALPDDILFS
ncbi:zinc ribbon domain-containing protein [Candidatus Solirubrobacter pratensis]|uniref:zinc ribbon domain-containing protein n=1 Tax=Candidatus Solirubrobacter pratensis TaxID=1298857 RepID=UPI000488C305|nr:zinc ribbon domain-containing protein [Candidatus Solirubrobacter pratensis]